MIINVINLGPWQEAISMKRECTPAYIQRTREERVLSICKQSKEQKFPLRFWEGIIDKRGGYAGINLSFKKIVRWAKENNEPMVTIGEDDLCFSAPGAWQYYLDQMPKEFDIYSAGIYSGQIVDGRIMNGWSGNTLVTVHERFYDFFLSITDDDHLDRRLGNHCHEKLFLVCEPFVCYQLSGYSDNHHRPTSHEAFLKKVTLFGR